MEEQWYFDGAGLRPFHVETLPRQNHSDASGHVGGLDSADGDHLLVTPRTPIFAFRTRAYFLGPALDLHDQSLCRKNRSRCAAGACKRRLAGRARLCRADESLWIKSAPQSVALPARKMHQRLVNTCAMRALGDVTVGRADGGFHFRDRIYWT